MLDGEVVKDKALLELRMGVIALAGKYIQCTYQLAKIFLQILTIEESLK